MNHELELIKEIVIESPPTKYTINYKKPKFDNKTGKQILKQDLYLTTNLFYNNSMSYHVVSKIIQESKQFLFVKIGRLPELEKLRIEIEIHTIKEIDLDNRAMWWCKLLLDILKTPTQRQIENATKRKKSIITTNTIPDDDTKVIQDIRMNHKHGKDVLIIRLYGRVKSTQTEIPLFFV